MSLIPPVLQVLSPLSVPLQETPLVLAVDGAFAAAVYSMMWYMRARAKTGEPFDPFKFASTVLLGMGVGVSMGLSGVVVTEITFAGRMVVYIGLVSIIEGFLKALYAEYVRRTYNDPVKAVRSVAEEGRR